MAILIQIITILYTLSAFHLAPSWSVPLLPVPNEEERIIYNPFKTKGGEESVFFEGDIRLKPGEDPYNSRKAYSLKKRSMEDRILVGSSDGPLDLAEHTWMDRRIPYTFMQLLPSNYRMIFEEAIAEWQRATCLEFVEKTSEDEDYLLFTRSEFGCSSFVGKKGGEQTITMGSGCLTIGHAIHEIGHAIGMWHEHSRPDRDTYINVIYENIIETEQDNFGILDERKFEMIPDDGYDVESIMHYGEYAFSRNNQRTITLRPDAPIKDCDNRLPMGQRTELSYKDKLRANKLYQCEVHLRNLVEPECVKLTPTPSFTAPTTTAMPTPTTTQPPVTPSVVSPTRLKSGNVLSLEFLRQGRDHGMKCTPSPGCIPRPCVGFFGANACTDIQHQFTIFNPTSKKIKSGNTVVLRSVYKPTTWLDCPRGGESRGCTLSQCVDNSAEAANSSYISDCESHQFKIYGVKDTGSREVVLRDGKIINSNHKIQLKHIAEDTYLNCSGKRCELGEPQTFTVNKLRE